ncbi:Os01g0381325, partial [Oryza sativa Japonica Group]
CGPHWPTCHPLSFFFSPLCRSVEGGIDSGDDNPATDLTDEILSRLLAKSIYCFTGTGAASSPTMTTVTSSPTRSMASSPTTPCPSTTSSSQSHPLDSIEGREEQRRRGGGALPCS